MNFSKLLYTIISLIVLTSIVSLSSCKKEVAVYNLNGKIYDPQLKKAVSSANVSLKASKVESGVYNPSYNEINSTSSSSNGNYSFEVEFDNVSGYRLDFTKNNYFDQSIDIKTEDLQNDAGLTMNTNLIPIGFVKLIIKNTSPQGTDDEIRFHLSNVDVKCKDCWTNDVITGTGPAYSFSETKQLSGEKKFLINWVVTKNSQQHVYQDTITSKAFSTVTFNINY